MPLQSSFRNKSRRFWLACLCALALLGLQGVGQWHRLAHGAGLAGAPLLNTAQASTAAFSDVWGHHSGDASCQLFDHLCDGHALTAPALTVQLPPPPRTVSWPAPARIDLATQWTYCARAPPTSA